MKSEFVCFFASNFVLFCRQSYFVEFRLEIDGCVYESLTIDLKQPYFRTSAGLFNVSASSFSAAASSSLSASSIVMCPTTVLNNGLGADPQPPATTTTSTTTNGGGGADLNNYYFQHHHNGHNSIVEDLENIPYPPDSHPNNHLHLHQSESVAATSDYI